MTKKDNGVNMKNFNIPFSPPDIGDTEIELVADALRSGWITTGPKTKLLEKKLPNGLIHQNVFA